MTLDEKLKLFRDQIACGTPAYMWIYDGEGRLLESNCPDEPVLAGAFLLFDCKRELYEKAALRRPVILSSSIGLMWAAAFAWEQEKLERAVVIGPVFTIDTTLRSVTDFFFALSQDKMDVSIKWQQDLARVLSVLPTFSSILLNQYALMLHCCLTGEKLLNSDIVIGGAATVEIEQEHLRKKDRHKVWIAEQGLLRMVREGDLNYKLAQQNAGSISSGVPLQSREPLRQAKTSTIVYISLCVRAAIEGGLSPEQAYSLGDAYIQSTENARDLSDITAISAAMYDDFVHRVHACRTNQKYSKQIQECCDYIELNVESKLEIEDLARRLGYTDYYFSRKFKEEVGVSLNNYITFAKIERAKFLLASTHAGIQEITERLGFCSRSYFGAAFRKVVGCSPAEYRKNYVKG